MKNCLSFVLAAVIATALAGPAAAADAPRYSKGLQKACASDYRRLRREYGIEPKALRLCMDRKGKSLTKTWVDALVDSGEVSRAEVQRRKKNGH